MEALHQRIEDSQSKLVITADGGWIRGKVVPLKEIVDEAAERCQAEFESQQKSCAPEVEQLTLLLKESEARYGKAA